MSLHHLDPRQAGTGAKPDVWITTGPMIGTQTTGFRAIDKRNKSPLTWGETEAAALAAARKAAGFGHVAERACDVYQADYCEDIPVIDEQACSICAWSRDAHRKEG